MSSGQRMHTRYFQVGGVFEDIPRRLGARRCARSSNDMESASASTRRCSTATRSSSSGRKGVGIVPRERLLELGVTGPLLRAAGEPWDLRKAEPLPRLRRLRLQDPGRHRRRLLRPLPRAVRRCGSRADHRAGDRGPARGAVHRRQPQGRAAAAARARHLDGGADPPLQARHRGLPGARRARPTADRGPARRARLLRRRRRLREAGARPHARPVVRQPAGAARHVRRRLHRRPDHEPRRCWTRSWEGSTGEPARRP